MGMRTCLCLVPSLGQGFKGLFEVSNCVSGLLLQLGLCLVRGEGMQYVNEGAHKCTKRCVCVEIYSKVSPHSHFFFF